MVESGAWGLIGSTYFGVLVIGSLHGLEPGHGWPVAFLYSIKTGRPMLYGLMTSGILAFFHFLSSIAAAAVFVVISSFLYVPTIILKYVAAGILGVLAITFWREKVEDEFEAQHGHLHGNPREIEHEHEHEHPSGERHIHVHRHAKSMKLSLTGIALYAFILGFAHEEEFALLALAVGGIDPWLLMIVYGLAVSASLIGVTLLCIKAFQFLLPRIQMYAKYVPKISAITLLIMAVAFILNIA
ncbi:MAG: nickel/cobalt transporter [Promethearchaeati archaeon SRVP18_Atabeyarchaeia-1]